MAAKVHEENIEERTMELPGRAIPFRGAHSPLLKPAELRELTAVLVTEVMTDCKKKDLLTVAEDVNGWVATAEEYVEFRKKRGQILRAREDTQGDIEV